MHMLNQPMKPSLEFMIFRRMNITYSNNIHRIMKIAPNDCD